PRLGGVSGQVIMGTHFTSGKYISQWKYSFWKQVQCCPIQNTGSTGNSFTWLGIPRRIRIIDGLRGRQPSPSLATGNNPA
ncbi:MAG: hypothetical protein ACRECQ_17950, partial [Burkholderiaceae bacterium]